MREILFRGKRVDDGDWVEGFFSKGRYMGYKGNTLQPAIEYEAKGVMCVSVIKPETVGQYTGLEDKNGKKIFEGDIVKLFVPRDNREPLVHKGKIIWWECGFAILYDDKVFGKDKITCLPYGKFIEVISNIHDNPELLQSE